MKISNLNMLTFLTPETTSFQKIPVLRSDILLMSIRISIWMPIQIRTCISIKTMPILKRILPQVLHILENREKFSLLFKAMSVYNVFPFHKCHDYSIRFGNFFERSKKSRCLKWYRSGSGKINLIRPDSNPDSQSEGSNYSVGTVR